MLLDDETTAEEPATEGITRTTRIYKESDFEAYPPYLPPESESELKQLYAATTDLAGTDRIWLIAQIILYAICFSLIIGFILFIVIAIYMAWKLYYED